MKNQRLIAKMVALAMITGGVVGVGTGSYLCYKGAENNNDYINDSRYIAGVLSMTVASPTLTIGFATYPYDNENKHDEDNTLTK